MMKRHFNYYSLSHHLNKDDLPIKFFHFLSGKGTLDSCIFPRGALDQLKKPFQLR